MAQKTSILTVLRMLTPIFRQLPSIDLILYHVSPIEGTLTEMEVQGDGVSQAWYQHTKLALV